MTTAFARYARYYDLLYRDKDYAGEARLVDGWLRAAGARPGALLDLGCGTGAHAREFARLGWNVTGLDASVDMIELARSRTPAGAGVTYLTGQATDFELARKFSAIVSLFHVASYLAGPGDLAAMLGAARRHLPTGGVLVFDFWHGPGVLADPPAVRVREIADGADRMVRTARPALDLRTSTVEVRYELVVRDPAGRETDRCEEVHGLRYYFLPEVKSMLERAGFVLLQTRAGLAEDALADRSWYGLVIARAG